MNLANPHNTRTNWSFFVPSESHCLFKFAIIPMKQLLSTVTLALVTCAGFLTSASAFGQIEEDPTQLLQLNTITTAVPFLMIAPDSRSGAMGDVGVALSPDANSLHWNPAKMAFSKNEVEMSLSSVSYTHLRAHET